MSHATLAPRDTTRTLGPGDVRITTTDSSLELAIIGASIQRAVKGTVAKAMDHEIHYPIADISDVRFEDGGLRFYRADGRKMSVFENSHVNGRKVSESFSPEEAKRFISAFRARKASRG